MIRGREPDPRLRLAAVLAGAVLLACAPATGAQAGLETVRALASQERHRAARAAFDALPAATRNAPGGRLLDGVLKARAGALDEATGIFEKLVRTHPERPEARINLALLDAARLGVPDLNTPLLDEGIEEDRHRATAWWALRDLYFRLIVFAYARSNTLDAGLVREEMAAGPSSVAPLRTPYSRAYPSAAPPKGPGDSGAGATRSTAGVNAAPPAGARAGGTDGTAGAPAGVAARVPAPSDTTSASPIAGPDGPSSGLPAGGVATPSDARDAPAATADRSDAARPGGRTVGTAGGSAGPAGANRPSRAARGGPPGLPATARPGEGEMPFADARSDEPNVFGNAAASYLDAAGDGLSGAPSAQVPGTSRPPIGGKTRPAPERPGARVTPERNTSYALKGVPSAASPDLHASSWGALLRAAGLAVGAVAVLAAIAGGLAMLLRGRGQDQSFRRRLERVAAPLTGSTVRDGPNEEESIFRPAEKRSRLSGLWDRVEARYPLLRIRQAMPVALGAAIAGAGGCWFSMWFLKVPFGWWSIPLCGLAGAGAAWSALVWLQVRQEAEFIRQFPEVVDQIVRLSGAGLPPLEAVSTVTEDTPDPVKPVFGGIRDALLAGLDADSTLRAASSRLRVGEFTLFAAVIRLQRRAGGGISSALSNLAETLRERRKTALRAHSSTAQSRLTLLVLVLMPVVVLGAQKFIAPQSIETLFNTESGLSLLRWGVALVVAGVLVARTMAARAVR